MIRRLSIAICIILLPCAAFATEVKEVVSPKGIKAWLVEEHSLPLVAVKLAFTNAGFAYDPPAAEGRANIASAMLMEGAGDLDSQAFNKALENEAIQLDFAIDEDLLRASLESLSDHKEKAFYYLGLALASPRLDDGSLDRVRRQTLSILIQQERDPGYLLSRGWQRIAFGNHAYAKPVLGTKNTIAAIQKSQVSDYLHRYLTRENLLVAVVGDITPEELGQLLDKYLANLPQHYDPDIKINDTALPAAGNQEVIDHDIPQTMVRFGTNGIMRSDPNYYAAFVMNQILGGGGSLTAKLGEEIREKRGLAYSVYSQLDPMAHAAVWEGGFATRNSQVGAALHTLRDTLKDFSQNGPSDLDMNNAKQYLTGSFVLGLDSNADVANYLISMQLYHLGRDYLDKRNQLIEAVTKDQVKAVAKTLADPAKLLVVMVGKPELEANNAVPASH